MEGANSLGLRAGRLQDKRSSEEALLGAGLLTFPKVRKLRGVILVPSRVGLTRLGGKMRIGSGGLTTFNTLAVSNFHEISGP